MEYKIYKNDTLIEFGRYKGKTILEVAKEDIKYLEWFIIEIDNVILDLDEELLNNDAINSIYYNVINPLCILKFSKK